MRFSLLLVIRVGVAFLPTVPVSIVSRLLREELTILVCVVRCILLAVVILVITRTSTEKAEQTEAPPAAQTLIASLTVLARPADIFLGKRMLANLPQNKGEKHSKQKRANQRTVNMRVHVSLLIIRLLVIAISRSAQAKSSCEPRIVVRLRIR